MTKPLFNKLSAKEVEVSLLRHILLFPNDSTEALDLMVPDDFYNQTTKKIFTEAKRIFSIEMTPDATSVIAGLNDDDKKKCQWIINQTSTPPDGSISTWMEILKNKRQLREAYKCCGEVQKVIMGEDQSGAVEMLEKEVTAISGIGNLKKTAVVDARGAAHEVIEDINRIQSSGAQGIPGLSTGIYDLDIATGGMSRSDLIIVAGRPSMGKSALAINIGRSITEDSRGGPVSIFSLEMSAKQLIQRILADETSIPINRIRSADLSEQEKEELEKAIEEIPWENFIINDVGYNDINSLKSSLRKEKRENNISGAIIDYIQLIENMNLGRNSSRENIVADVTRGLKGMAKELDIPIIALSQLNRGLEQRSNKRPMMSDLRESGAIEQDADIILFVYREYVYTQEANVRNKAEIIIGKNRNGPITDIECRFDGEFCRFYNASGAKTGPNKKRAPKAAYDAHGNVL